MNDTPKPNTQFVSWFYSEFEKGGLNLDPKYQRNPVWSIGQKCFLIDSLIFGCPIPQIYLNVVSSGRGRDRKTVYEVVDGQQRLRTILEFINEKWKLIKTSRKSYPVSPEYKRFIGKTFSELPLPIQERIWNHSLAVQELRDWDSEEIRALFRRLNLVNVRLNAQELRHSQYFGRFMETVELLADLPAWENLGLFSREDYRRMRDREYISELLLLLMKGPQQAQEALDQTYADYDVNFPQESTFNDRFKLVLRSIDSIADYLSESRYVKKADFYGIFSAVIDLNKGRKRALQLEDYVVYLQRLEREVSTKPIKTMRAEKYHDTVIEGSSKKQKRLDRKRILLDLFGYQE